MTTMPTRHAILAIMLLSGSAYGVDLSSYFNDAKSYGSTFNSGIIANAKDGAHASSILPMYGTTSAEAALMGDGKTSVVIPATTKVDNCAHNPLDPDKYKRQECEAINFWRKNPSVRPQFDISRKNDPVVIRAKAIQSDPTHYTGEMPGLSGAYSSCTEKTIPGTPITSDEVCAEVSKTASSTCQRQRVVEVKAEHEYKCDQSNKKYVYHTCQRWLEVIEVCDVQTPQQTETIVESYWWCGDSCYFPREWEGIGAFKRAASRAGNIVGPTSYEYICDVETCYSKYTVVTSGGAPITLNMNGTTFGTGHVLTYDDANGVCLGGICTWKNAKKPMVYFISSASGECKEKVWVPPHHKGRYPGHWACKDTGGTYVCPSGYTLTTNSDGSKSCIGNCTLKEEWHTNCGPLESRP